MQVFIWVKQFFLLFVFGLLCLFLQSVSMAQTMSNQHPNKPEEILKSKSFYKDYMDHLIKRNLLKAIAIQKQKQLHKDKTAADFKISNKPSKKLSFKEDEQIAISLSMVDVNRLSIEDDKVTSIYVPQGYAAIKQDSSGSVYINITQRMPFTLFVVSEKGHHFSVFVKPKAIPGQTYRLKALDEAPKRPDAATKHWERNNYQKLLVMEVMKHLITGEPSESYQIQALPAQKPQDFYGCATLTPMTFLKGEALNGLVLRLQNKLGTPLTLSANQFYQHGVRAVALGNQVVPPKGETSIFLVLSQDTKNWGSV